MDIEYLLKAFSPEELNELTAALPNEYECRGLEVPQLAGSVTLADTVVTESTPESPAPVDVFATLTPEQQERARAKQTALAEHFSTEAQPLSPEDFGVVAVGEGENRSLFVMLTTGNGLYKGSYNTIMGDDGAFMLEVDGEQVDTRKDVTWDLYQAFIDQAKTGDDPLPDSAALSEENDEPRTGTWLTGEEPDGFGAGCGDVRRRGARRFWRNRYYVWYDLRVRPAAAI